ncbi:questin oxidase family protein [Kitasatospora sp. NPDC052896]|uniref:questin oxidase family protein n=1 Tax=Kitasatospora sp. NPDC052896 TaxID=3364061 RepID=UPI0037C93705
MKHAVVALAGLGVASEKVDAYYRDYATLTTYGFGLEPPRPSKYEITAANWERFLGQRTSFGSYCDFFDGAGESAVDSLLRVAAAWEEDHDALRRQVLALTGDVEAGIAGGIHPELARSGLRFRIASMLGGGHPLLYRTPAWIDDQDASTSWEQPYYAAALLYLAKPGDFIVLHLVTSLHAMEQIARHLPADQQRDAVRYFWIGMLGIACSGADFPKRSRLEAPHAEFARAVDDSGLEGVWHREWARTVSRAVEEEEEHNPKLVYVMRLLWRRSGGRSVCRTAAAQFTATGPDPGCWTRGYAACASVVDVASAFS